MRNQSALRTILFNSPPEEQTHIMNYYISQPYQGILKSLTENLLETYELNVFTAILEELDIMTLLDSGVYTVFAPIISGQLNLSGVKYHIVEGSYPRHYLERLKYTQLQMSNDRYIQFWGDKDSVCIRDESGAIVRLGEQIYCKNGIIHIIEQNFSYL